MKCSCFQFHKVLKLYSTMHANALGKSFFWLQNLNHLLKIIVCHSPRKMACTHCSPKENCEEKQLLPSTNYSIDKLKIQTSLSHSYQIRLNPLLQ